MQLVEVDAPEALEAVVECLGQARGSAERIGGVLRRHDHLAVGPCQLADAAFGAPTAVGLRRVDQRASCPFTCSAGGREAAVLKVKSATGTSGPFGMGPSHTRRLWRTGESPRSRRA